MKWQPTPVLLPGKSHRLRSLVGYSPWGRKESDTTEQLSTMMLEMNDEEEMVFLENLVVSVSAYLRN